MALSNLTLVMVNLAVDEIAEGRNPTNAIYDGTELEALLQHDPNIAIPTFKIAVQAVPRIGAELAKLALYLAMMADTEDPSLAPHIMMASDAVANEGNMEFLKTMVWHRLSDEAREQLSSIGGGGSWAGPEDI